MGYTHYWNHRDLGQARWKSEFLPKAKMIVEFSEVQLSDSYESTDAPLLNDMEVRINGLREDRNEDFFLSIFHTKFDFCKTARKPYDKVVAAILMLTRHLFEDCGFEWSSDGESGDHQEGLYLLRQVAPDAVMEQCGALEDEEPD